MKRNFVIFALTICALGIAIQPTKAETPMFYVAATGTYSGGYGGYYDGGYYGNPLGYGYESPKRASGKLAKDLPAGVDKYVKADARCIKEARKNKLDDPEGHCKEIRDEAVALVKEATK